MNIDSTENLRDVEFEIKIKKEILRNREICAVLTNRFIFSLLLMFFLYNKAS